MCMHITHLPSYSTMLREKWSASKTLFISFILPIFLNTTDMFSWPKVANTFDLFLDWIYLKLNKYTTSKPNTSSTSLFIGCKIYRKKCWEKCVLELYFPKENSYKFLSVHSVFRYGHVIILLQVCSISIV